MVRVPVPHSAERAYRIIHDGLQEIFEARWLVGLFLGAAVLTGVLCVPGIGIPLATGILILGALGYGELIRQCGVDFWDFDDWKKPGPLLQRIGVATLFGLGLAAPMLLSPRGFTNPPRFSTIGVILGLIGALILPVAMLLTYARDNSGPLGWRRGSSVLVRYPVASFLPLLLIPLGMVFSELLLIVITSWQGMFPFLVLDLFPGGEYYANLYKIPMYGNYTKSELPDMRFIHLYLRRLHQGYMLTTALPATLSKKTLILASPWTLELTDRDYLTIRAMYTQVTTMVLFLFLALQARWLGAISTLESNRSLQIDSQVRETIK